MYIVHCTVYSVTVFILRSLIKLTLLLKNSTNNPTLYTLKKADQNKKWIILLYQNIVFYYMTS